jgi:hypothetical protein
MNLLVASTHQNPAAVFPTLAFVAHKGTALMSRSKRLLSAEISCRTLIDGFHHFALRLFSATKPTSLLSGATGFSRSQVHGLCEMPGFAIRTR